MNLRQRMTRRMHLSCLALLVCGCTVIEVGVTNPIVGLTTVAVVPFFNLSQERSVDGRRFALAYFTELQKTPGFQVLPVGVTEQAIFDNRLEMSSAEDALRLAEILKVDAVVMGAVTDYDPYYPPRIGLQVSWYSPRPWTFWPGIPVDETARERARPDQNWRSHGLWPRRRARRREECPPGMQDPRQYSAGDGLNVRCQSPTDGPQFPAPPSEPTWPATDSPTEMGGPPTAATDSVAAPPTVNTLEFDPRQPLMSYTRMFDGADPRLVGRLRDYVELSGDLRSGGWEAYLHRTEDFIRFTSHVMLVEMLQLHGGEAKKRVVLKHRNDGSPH